MNEPYPTPEEALADIQNLEKWIKSIKDRRELTRLKAKNSLESVPPRLAVVSAQSNQPKPVG